MNNKMRKQSKHRSKRRLQNSLAAAAAATTAAVVRSMVGAPTLEVGAFSMPPPTFTAQVKPSSTPPPNIVGCAATRDHDILRRRGPLHQSSSSVVMSIHDELLKAESYSLQSKLTAFQQGAPRGLRTSRKLSSLSGGKYGGLGTFSEMGSSSSTTSLSVSRSTDNILGFNLEDFDPPPNNDDSNEELQFSFEDFAEYDNQEDNINNPSNIDIRTVKIGGKKNINGRRMASTTSQRVAASLLKKRGSNVDYDVPSSSRSIRPTNKSKLSIDVADVPPWLPWVPTTSQIHTLKVFELRAACVERDLIPLGSKEELQSRFIIWSTIQDRKRVKDRIGGLKDLIERSKSKESSLFDDEVDGNMDVLLFEGKVDAEEYNVNALREKRRAITKEKKVKNNDKNNQGILGLVDENYFSTNATEVGIIDTDEDEEEIVAAAEDNSMINSASITRLSNTFNAPSSNFTNREVREMYIQAKTADQSGNRRKAKEILHKLRLATPHDMRVIRRLSRMEQEDGNMSSARTLLQQALVIEPNNAHLLHGLGQLERTAGNDYTAKKYYRRAIKRSTDQSLSFPNPYHALGTLEHTHGNIRSALGVIKEGIKHCPTNHRLYHALGDVYLDANMLDLAEETYLEGIQHGPHWSKAFFYTSLSFVSYAKGYKRDCRALLRQSLEITSGMHAQGVVALAQLEESEENIPGARKVYRDAISRYEKKRRSRSPFNRRGKNASGSCHQSRKPLDLEKDNNVADVFDTSSLVDGRGIQYTKSHPGDKWMNVFKSWARMEAIHGTYETTHVVFSKAARLFSSNVSLLIQWAELQADHGETEKARLLYEAACHRIGSRSAEPYQLFAEFEMKRGNFVLAQSILMRGAQAVANRKGENTSSSSDDTNNSISSLGGGKNGLARLFHTWGVCEYYLGTYSRAEQLFDDALRVTGPEEEDSTMRSLILYSMARLEFSREENLLAQHCIALSLKENLLPGGNYLVWKLWSQIASKMKNEQLAIRCNEQAKLRREEEMGGTVSDLSRLLGERRLGGGRLPDKTGSAMKDMFRKTPWYSQVCPPSGRVDKNWYSGSKLWEL